MTPPLQKSETQTRKSSHRGSFSKRRQRHHAFTFVELLVALAIGAAVLGVAALAFYSITGSGRSSTTYENVQIGVQASANFYNINSETRSVWFAPNPGLLVRSDQLRAMFLEDVQKAAAVYCLPRSGLRYIHPGTFALSGTSAVTNFDFRRLDTSEAFRQFLAGNGWGAGTYSVNPFASGAVRGKNLTIMTVRSVNGSQLIMGPTYEMDFVRVTNGRAGIFASVRRYAGTNRLTTGNLYDIFYADPKGGTAMNSTNFFVAASFERTNRSAGTVPAAYRIAGAQPFYYVWWPDPLATKMPSGTNYMTAMPDRTSYFMVVPMFPQL